MSEPNHHFQEIHLRDETPNVLGEARTERRDATENRARILCAAESLFAQSGVDAVAMSDIAKAAGVGKGTLYRRFANKGELCLALMDGRLRAFQDCTLAQLRSLHEAGLPRVEQLRETLTAIVTFTEEHMPLLREVQRDGVMGGGETLSPHFIWQYLTVRGLLRAAVQAGEIAPTVDVEWMADALLAPLSAQFYTFLREVRGFSPERIADGLWMQVASLAADPASHSD